MLDLAKVFRVEKYSDNRFHEENQSLQRQCTASGLLAHHYSIANNTAIWSVYTLVFLFSLYLTQVGVLNVGDLVAVHLLLTQLIATVFMIADVLPALEVGKDAVASIHQLLSTHTVSHSENTPASPRDIPAPPPESQALLQLSNISFKYPTNQHPILDNVTLSIGANEHICILGDNGAGKSTLIHIVLQLLNIQQGTAYFPDARIAYIPSNTYLLHDTVLENIRLYDAAITTEDIETTLARITRTETGKRILPPLNTKVGPSNLSDGQRQLIGIARALVRQPALLVVDEVTKSLDKDSRAHIEHLLAEASRHCALLGTAHYLPPRELYERYFLLSHGSLHEMNYSEVGEYFARF